MLRFYGGTPQTWLRETPIAVVLACLGSIPAMRAEESQTSATEHAVGLGLKKGPWIGRQWARWSRLASEVAASRKRAEPASAPVLSGMGIGVRKGKRGG